eukprot:5296783-Alexandrium_andersonii.AAC.1
MFRDRCWGHISPCERARTPAHASDVFLPNRDRSKSGNRSSYFASRSNVCQGSAGSARGWLAQTTMPSSARIN